MILSGLEIKKQREAGTILIDPFNPMQVNPASYDLRLGSTIKTYKRGRYRNLLDTERRTLDSANKSTLECETDHIPHTGFLLHPGTLYLMHTIERVRTDLFVPIVDGKSSVGRLGVFVHVTAGFGDPGFDGQYTLEVLVTYPTKVYAGMRFCQIRFHAIQGEFQLYDGNYRDAYSEGPQPSRIWRQFE